MALKILGIPFGSYLHQLFFNPANILNVIKELITIIYLKCTVYRRKKRFDARDVIDVSRVVENNFMASPTEFGLEWRRDDTLDSASDSILLFGTNSKKERLLTRISIGADGLATVWLYIGISGGPGGRNYTLPDSRKWVVPPTGKDCFAGGGLRIRCLVPMRKWRVSFNGLLKESASWGESVKHVKFSFIWTALSDAHDLLHCTSESNLAGVLASQNWIRGLPSPSSILQELDSYSQSGTLMGTLQVEESEEQQVFLWGSRIRSVESCLSYRTSSVLDIFGETTEGNSFYVGQRKFHGSTKELHYGFVVTSGSMEVSAETCLMSKMKTKKDNVPFHTAIIEFRNKNLSVDIHVGSPTQNVLQFDEELQKTAINFCPIKFGEETGQGVVIWTEKDNNSGTKFVKPVIKIKPQFQPIPFVVPLNSEFCTIDKISGGKGSSLSKLKTFIKNNTSFIVPNGIVVSTSAYQSFINAKELKNSLLMLENAVRNKFGKEVQQACEETVKIITKATIPDRIFKVIEKQLKEVFSEITKFAVRSSAVGEDSEITSAAGQMDTILGVWGNKQLKSAIVQCWASQFSYNAVQYKRQTGQPINSPMAVVIQEMVNADVAGVMFTCNPVTGNSAHITITGNYGLGESVVSASADPDTFELERDLNGNFVIKNVIIGKKGTSIVMAESQGTTQVPVPQQKNMVACVTNEVALRIGKVGAKIEEDYGCPVNVEWAVSEDIIYVLQVRPVTTFDKETDFEIAHDLDSPIRCETEYLSVANVGEIMPGVTSPLSMSTFIKAYQVANALIWMKADLNFLPICRYYDNGFAMCQHHLLLNILDVILIFYKNPGNVFTDGHMVLLFGRVLDKEMLDMSSRRNSVLPNRTIPLGMKMSIVTQSLLINQRLKAIDKKYLNHSIDLSRCSDAVTMYKELLKGWSSIGEVIFPHGFASMVSSMFNVGILSTLASAQGSWNSEIYSDLAYILSGHSKVESADIPIAIDKLSATINKDIGKDIFHNFSPQEALDWLETTTTSAGDEFRNFLAKYGHRCVKEFDLYIQPWGTNPLQLVKILQETVATVKTAVSKQPQKDSVMQTIKNLKTKVPLKSKLLLSILIPFARWGVGLREKSKSLVVKFISSLRKGYWAMAEQAVKGGLIPEKDLIFFLSFYEVHDLLQGNCPRLIQKAIRRRQMFPKLENLRFPEITKGIPRPISVVTEQRPNKVTFEMKGIPVCKGIAKGIARVINSLEEASKIQSDEILVAYSTDIGWSPYFPLLAGVATELGGLMSHSAVVAREYGLPCVVGLHGATSAFKNGDHVVLDGNTGILKRVINTT